MRKLQLRTLVPVPELVDSSNRQLVGPSKQLALLVFLASQPQARATREEVLAYLAAGDSTDPRASLRQLLYQLRRGVGDVVTGAEELTLRRDDLEFDVDTFRSHVAAGRLSDAAALYRADFLGSWLPRDAPEMEEWIESQRQELRRVRDTMPLTRASSALDAAHHHPRAMDNRAAWRLGRRGLLAVCAVALLVFLAPRKGLRGVGDSEPFGAITLVWGNPAKPTRVAVVELRADGRLRVRDVAGVSEYRRTVMGLVNWSQTSVARACVVPGSDSSTTCLDRPFGTLRTLTNHSDAFPVGWLGDAGLVVEARRPSRTRFERRLLLVPSAEQRIDTLSELGSDVQASWPNPRGRYLAAARRQNGLDELVLFDVDTRAIRTIDGCEHVAKVAWDRTNNFAALCLQAGELLFGSVESTKVTRVSIGASSFADAVWSPEGARIAVVSAGSDARLDVLTATGTRLTSVTLPASGARVVGWFAASDSAGPTLAIADDFDDPSIATRHWKPFGFPAPRVASSGGVSGGALFHNGDASYESGIALREPLRLDRGLMVEWWARIPITAALWQSVYVCLCAAPADSFRIGAGPPVSDSVQRQILRAEFPNPHGPADRQMLVNLAGDISMDLDSLPRRLQDGRWHSYRLTLLPDGRAWLTGDGLVLSGPVRVELARDSTATLVVQGRSVGTRVLIDQLRVWRGAVMPPGVR